MLKKECVLVIETDGGGISSYELTEFFRYFRAAYVAGVKISEGSGISALSKDKLIGLVNRIKLMQPVDVVDYLFKIDCENNELEFLDIQRENPLSCIILGSASVLEFVVIFCGATVVSNGVEVKIDEVNVAGIFKAENVVIKIPPLSKGLNELRAAFGKEAACRKKIDDL